VIDPWISLAALSYALARTPFVPLVDPGPNPACPDDMRLVHGVHHENMAHLCVEPKKGPKDTHCYAYHPGISVLEGPTTTIRVCMDRFEAPNVRGARPMVLESYVSGKRWCAERGKRLCSEREWELACEGPSHQPLAYGWAVNVKLCNSNKGWKQVDFELFDRSKEDAEKETKRLWQGTPSGRYASCMSPFGVFDMMGNVEEWVTAREGRKHAGALMGGFWSKAWTGCRGTNDAHFVQFAFYETGFRCCKDPKAATPSEDGKD
jgi:hypothetical protein